MKNGPFTGARTDETDNAFRVVPEIRGGEAEVGRWAQYFLGATTRYP
jgi:hypothetical protein